MKDPVVVSWSGGKDSALALHELLSSQTHEVAGLLTTVTADHDRISMHGVRRSLLEQQARALALPLTIAEIPAGASNQEYAASMGAALRGLCDQGIRTIAFGDLFLAEIRRYREQMLEPLGMRAIFPLWGRDTAALAREILASGVRATLTCVDPRALPAHLAGRAYDESLLAELPAHVDPCGERGEFHTFVHDGPIFARPVPVRAGEVVERGGFVFADLLPG